MRCWSLAGNGRSCLAVERTRWSLFRRWDYRRVDGLASTRSNDDGQPGAAIADGQEPLITRDDVHLAHRLASLAVRVAYSFDRADVKAWTKSDGSIVTDVDVAVDDALRRVLSDERRGDGVLTEESPYEPSVTGRDWIIDPIDGTTEFRNGQASWGTHIALTVDGVVQLAIITRPDLAKCWWAARGQGAFAGPIGRSDRTVRLRVSDVDDLRTARAAGLVEPGSPQAALLASHAQWIDEPISEIGALLEGRLDVVLDDAGAAWDQAPAVLLVVESGGRFSDPLGGQRFDLGWGLYSNQPLHDRVAALLAGGV